MHMNVMLLSWWSKDCILTHYTKLLVQVSCKIKLDDSFVYNNGVEEYRAQFHPQHRTLDLKPFRIKIPWRTSLL